MLRCKKRRGYNEKVCCFFICVFLVAIFATSAKAAFTRSYAVLNWSQFTWQGISLVPGQLDPTISWTYQKEYISAENQDHYYDDWADNWSDDLVGVVSTPPSEAGAETLSDTIGSYGEVYTSGYAEGYAVRWGNFQVSGSGLIVFAIPYTISGEIDADSGLEYAWLEGSVALEVWCDSNPSRDSYSQVYFYDDGDIGTWSEDGVISVVLYFNDGEIGTFLAGTYTYAEQSAVPIPSSIIILTSGIGIIFIHRSYAS